jgi:PhzF family phenazine biosynthesis protein
MTKTNEITSVTAQIVNGFVTNGSGGNPAGVVLDADGLSDDQMLQIAEKIGVSETAFVSASQEAGFKLDFFTPNRRIAHCGHATIAAFSYLAQLARVSEGETSKMTVDGPRKIIIRGEQSFMEQVAPRYTTPKGWEKDGITGDQALAAIGLGTKDLIPGADMRLVNTGNSFLIIPVKDAQTLGAITPDQEAIAHVSEALDLIGYYVFALNEDGAETATTRMFGPRYAIAEESATGMAAGPLGCYLRDIMGYEGTHFDIAQGHFMTPPSPSRISVDLALDDAGQIASLTAGGFGKAMREMTISLD